MPTFSTFSMPLETLICYNFVRVTTIMTSQSHVIRKSSQYEGRYGTGVILIFASRQGTDIPVQRSLISLMSVDVCSDCSVSLHYIFYNESLGPGTRHCLINTYVVVVFLHTEHIMCVFSQPTLLRTSCRWPISLLNVFQIPSSSSRRKRTTISCKTQ